MYVIQIYAYGSGHRVRMHHHPDGRDDRCNADCYEYAPQRAYGRKGDKPSETRALVAAAVQRAVMTAEISHQEFLLEVGEQMVLPLDRI